MKLLIGVGVLMLVCAVHTASAAIVMDLTFAGDFDGDSTPGNVTFRLKFDSTDDASPANPNIGSYTAALTLFSGGASVNSQQPVTVTVERDLVDQDRFAISTGGFKSTLDVDGVTVDNVEFMLASPANNMFASDALPLSPAFASNATFVLITLGHSDSGQGFILAPPTVSIFTPVPEPAQYVLLLAGFAAVIVTRRSRRRTRMESA
jgi:hypothetical protein